MFRSTLEEDDRIDPAEALMREVGAQLREARLERGEELDQVADNLRIKRAYLEGIEGGDLSIMPGRTYALGFLRSYADHLGFDGDDLIKQIKSTVENLTDQARLHVRTPLPESRLPKTSLVVLSLAMLGGVYAGWMYLDHRQDQLDVETVAEVPDELQRLARDSLPAAISAREPQGRVTTSAASAASEAPADPAASVRQRPTTSDPEDVRAVAPDVQAGVGDVARSEDQDVLPPAVRGSRTTASDPSGSDAPPASGAEPGRAQAPPVETVAPDPAAAADALDRLIEAERTGSAPGDARPRTDAPAADRGAEGAAGSRADDGATITPDAGPAGERETTVADTGQAASAPRDSGPSPGRAQADSTAGVQARSNEASGGDPPPADGATGGAAERPAVPGSAEAVVAALGPTAGGAPETRVHEPDNADARVVIYARERSWIRITSESGDYLRTRTLEAGDVFLVPDRADLTLWTGNAGGIQVIVDGETLPSLGEEGTIKKDVALDPDSLRAQLDAQR